MKNCHEDRTKLIKKIYANHKRNNANLALNFYIQKTKITHPKNYLSVIRNDIKSFESDLGLKDC